MEFCNKLKEIRQQEGVTLRKLGEKVCISYSIMNAIENGRFQPSKEMVISIAYGLKYENVEELLGLAGFGSSKRMPEI